MMSRILLRPTCLLLLTQLAIACESRSDEEWTCGDPHSWHVCLACETGDEAWFARPWRAGGGSQVFVLAEETVGRGASSYERGTPVLTPACWKCQGGAYMYSGTS